MNCELWLVHVPLTFRPAFRLQGGVSDGVVSHELPSYNGMHHKFCYFLTFQDNLYKLIFNSLESYDLSNMDAPSRPLTTCLGFGFLEPF